MEKLILNDKTEISINDGMTANKFTVTGTVDDIDDLYKKLTESNLEEFKIASTTGEVFATLVNKKVANISFDGSVITATLTDVDMVAKKIKELQDTVDQLTVAVLEGGNK